jgi:predicted DNA-binding transcriptional regulator AlpA
MDYQHREIPSNYFRAKEIQRIFKISKSTFHRFQQRGIFPRPIKIGTMSFWTETDITNLQNSMEEKSRRH